MKNRGTVGLIAGIVVLVVAQGFAQEGDRPPVEPVGRDGQRMRMGPPRGGMFEGREGRPGGGGMGFGGEGALIGGILNNPKVAETLGLTEEQVKSLQTKLDGLRKEIATLTIDLENASMEQARLLTTQVVDEAAVMAAVDKAGEMRTKIARLTVQQLLAVKKILTPEQIEKARTMMRERFEKARERFNSARDQGDGGGPGQWRRPRERGGRGPDEGRPPEGTGAKPAPPPPEQAL